MEAIGIYRNRLQQLQRRLKERKVDAILVTNPQNIWYLSGFRGISPHERESILLVTTDECILYLPMLYAQEGSYAVTVVNKLVRCVIDQERVGILTLFISDVSSKAKVLIEERNLSVAEFQYLKQEFSGSITMSQGEIEAIRVIKDQMEVALIRQAVSITDAVFSRLIQFLQNEEYRDVTEQQIVYRMQEWYLKEGGEEFGFDPIVAVGATSSQPHYRSGQRRLMTGMPLLVDFGISIGGYTGDLTRTIYLGSAPQRFRDDYATVLACNQMSIESVRPGVDVSELQKQAVTFFEERGVADHFIHSLGHGVGLDIHEEPFVRTARELILVPGMTLTIEPGLYFADEYGIRIEDYCLITENGCEVLSSSNKVLLEIK